MNPKPSRLFQRYRMALGRHLEGDPGASLATTTRLGRQAVAEGLEILDLALVHERAMEARVSAGDSPAVRNRLAKRAGTFFAQVILPLEETHGPALEANARLSRATEVLKQRSLELAASDRALRKEAARCRVLEERLRQSELQSGRLLKQSEDFQEKLRHLTRQVLSGQEDDRRKISRELHDVIAQALTGITVQLATLKAEATVNTSGLIRKISLTQGLVEKSVDVVHRFARELRPAVLDDLGLIPALHSYLKGFTKETGIRVNLTVFAGVEELDSARRTVLYRVAQEALTNVARHAAASRVDASIERIPKGVRLQLQDDGKSFEAKRVLHDRKSKRLGLIGMRERVEMVGGRFTIESAPGEGTTIRAEIPFGNGARVETGS